MAQLVLCSICGVKILLFAYCIYNGLGNFIYPLSNSWLAKVVAKVEAP